MLIASLLSRKLYTQYTYLFHTITGHVVLLSNEFGSIKHAVLRSAGIDGASFEEILMTLGGVAD
jgi:hypothetical protein